MASDLGFKAGADRPSWGEEHDQTAALGVCLRGGDDVGRDRRSGPGAAQAGRRRPGPKARAVARPAAGRRGGIHDPPRRRPPGRQRLQAGGQGPLAGGAVAHPYIKDGRIDAEKDPKGVKNRETLVKQAKRYTDAGYVYVLQDVRGKGRSQGFYTAFENDIEDGYDAVEWAGTQPWSNGKVGMTGGSALGITANSAALAAPPHLKAAYVVVAPADRLSYSYPGGVLKEKDTIGWLAGQGIRRRPSTRPVAARWTT